MSDDERNDPFADLDTDTDRDGDPFNELDELSDDDASGESSAETDTGPSAETGTDPAVDIGTEQRSETDADRRGSGSDPDRSVDTEGQFSNVQRLSDALAEKEPDRETFDFDAPSKDEFLEDVDEDEIAAAVEEELAGGVPDEARIPDEGPDQEADNPFEELEQEADGMTGGIEQQDEEEILEALGEQDGDPFSDEELFTEADVTTVDANRVWESLDEDDSVERSATEIQEDVSKHRFCKQCEYFSGPPGSHCTHETAEIMQYLDMDTVRVLNCPVVARERQIERE